MLELVSAPLRVSIVTVCYNSAATIEETLKSVQAQSWPYIEHVVIDGGSTDETLSILDRYSDRLAVVVSEQDKGIYDAMNKGIARASGEIIAFLNADDTYAGPRVIEDIARVMATEELDALYGDVGVFKPEQPDRFFRIYNSGHFRPDRLSTGWMPAHPALFVRSELFDRLGPFKDDYRIAGDFEFAVRLFLRTDILYRHRPGVLVHMQAGGISNSSLSAKLRQNREVLRACRENGIATSWPRLLSRYFFKLAEFRNYSRPKEVH